MTGPSADWHRLAQYVIDRRNTLGLTQGDVKAQGGPSPATLRNIEGGLQTSYKPRVLSALERVLRWEAGSVRAILTGDEPTLKQRPSSPSPVGELRLPAEDEPEREPTMAEVLAQLDGLRRRIAELEGRANGTNG